MPSAPWRFSRCCAALLALLISAIGGFRVAVDEVPATRLSAVAVVRDLAGLPVQDQTTPQDRQLPVLPDAGAVPGTAIPAGRRVPAPALLCGSALGPRAP